MPIKRRLQRVRPANAEELTRLLREEWTKPKKRGQPIIIIDGGKGAPVHIYVVWDRWGELNQTERSEIIMDVVDDLPRDAQLPPDSIVTVAMGLTTEEANRMGIRAR